MATDRHNPDADARCGCCRSVAALERAETGFVQTRRAFLLRALAAGGTALALPLLCAPAAADIFQPTIADQFEIGEEVAQQVMRDHRVVNDERSRRFVQIGYRLLDGLTAKERGPWSYRYHVLDSKEINSFALPGGHIFIFTGLLDRLKSDESVAAVTAHEMTHVRKQHWAKAAGARLKRDLVLTGVLDLTHAGMAWRAVSRISDNILTLKYSRTEEDEADAGGLDNMVQAGFDPHGMLDLFHVLKAAEAGAHLPPPFLMDHPLTDERIAATQARIAQIEAEPQ
jgi:predicted Zn-dependent protease